MTHLLIVLNENIYVLLAGRGESVVFILRGTSVRAPQVGRQLLAWSFLKCGSLHRNRNGASPTIPDCLLHSADMKWR